jgi:lipopolysaccharide cholinephosphotransferase
MGLGGKFVFEAIRQSGMLKELTQDEKRQLQLILLDILKDLISVCNKNGFCYMLVCGSALGAVRHKGFIPWDDDLDVGILRKDYVQFLNTFKKISNKYDVGYPDGISHCATVFAKIYLKGTKNIEIVNLSAPFYNGIYLDVFPIENMPDSKLKNGFYGLFFDAIFRIIHCVKFYEYTNIKIKQCISYDKRSRCFYQMRLILGFLFSFFPHKKWCYLYNKWISSLPDSNHLGLPMIGKKRFQRCRLRKEFFIPTTFGIFERAEVRLPNNCHEHLRNTYGEYMKIPDVSERERHFVVEFDPGEFNFNEPYRESYTEK